MSNREAMLAVMRTALRVILYARVSTDEQADKGYSVPSQFAAMRKYAAQNGFTIVGDSYYDMHTGLRVVNVNNVWQFADMGKAARLDKHDKPIEPALGYVDDYTGTVPIEQRPEGRKAYEYLKSGQADALVAFSVDRLVRPPEEGDEWEMPLLIRGLAKLGKELHAVNRGKLETSFAGLLIAMLDAKSAGDERRKIIKRTIDGRNGKAHSGKVVGGGKPPYGYRYVYDDNKKVTGLAIVDAEGHIVKLIYQWYVYGDADNDYQPMRAHTIARRLSEMKIRTPDKRKGVRKREDCMWGEPTINYILQNELYAGIYRYGRGIGSNSKDGKRPLEEQIAVSVPAIVDRQLWNAAQERREYNKRMSKRNCRHEYLLRGMGKCGECDSALTGRETHQYLYYHCCQARNHFAGLEHICRQKYVRAEVLEYAVWDYILKQWSDATDFERKLRKLQQDELDSLQPKRERLEIVMGLIADCEREAANTARAMQHIGDSDDPVWQNLDHSRKELKRRYQGLTTERDELLLALDTRQYTDERIAAALRTREDVVTGLGATTFEDKRRVLDFLRVEVTVKNGTAWVSSVVTAEAVSIDLNTS